MAQPFDRKRGCIELLLLVTFLGVVYLGGARVFPENQVTAVTTFTFGMILPTAVKFFAALWSGATLTVILQRFRPRTPQGEPIFTLLFALLMTTATGFIVSLGAALYLSLSGSSSLTCGNCSKALLAFTALISVPFVSLNTRHLPLLKQIRKTPSAEQPLSHS